MFTSLFRPDISFILLTNQDYEKYARIVIKSIHDTIIRYHIKYSYEILLYSSEEPLDKDIIWVKDEINEPGNTVYGLNKMFNYSNGKYIFMLNDDHLLPYPDSYVNQFNDKNEPLKAVEFLQSDVFKNRRFKVTSIGAGSNVHPYGSACVPNLTCPSPYPLSDELKNPKYTQTPHRHLVMGYPVLERQTVIKELRGFLFHPSFHHHYADNWLPFFIGESGEQIEICKETSLQGFCQSGGKSNTTNDEKDYFTFTRLVDDFVNGRNKEYV